MAREALTSGSKKAFQVFGVFSPASFAQASTVNRRYWQSSACRRNWRPTPSVLDHGVIQRFGQALFVSHHAIIGGQFNHVPFRLARHHVGAHRSQAIHVVFVNLDPQHSFRRFEIGLAFSILQRPSPAGQRLQYPPPAPGQRNTRTWQTPHPPFAY
uniref:AgtB n=1 Tax=Pseudomonas chlororaphis TaxID=333 RepID=Q840J0_PSECL|nr:AgtB [Pseudomonas chlororaphis]